MNWLKSRLKERTSYDGIILIGGGLAMLLMPISLAAYGMIAWGAWTLLKSESND
jgi:hypothetical protein|tara:strand:- start:1562 stop:1723 length:162 start_codon:yes stop_codon:yes gene_type:complete